MPGRLSLEVVGLTEVNRALQLLAERGERAAGQALREEAEIEMTEAKRRTPVDTGTLRSSGKVTGPDADLAVKLEFGGAAEEYAIEVHENLETFHKTGQAKFLESTILESAPHLPARVGRRMLAILEERF